jgi:hypothetical protein
VDKSLAARSALFVTAGVTALGAGVIPAFAVPGDPPGNNGTIKIDDVPFDDHPNNEPHVGCPFQVDFYGYDKGDLEAQVIFTAQPPTQRDSDSQVLLTDTVFIGEDDNSGGGSEEGLDASETYTLDFTGITPHDQQGHHVKLTIHADGSHGADVKHKVFWVKGCPSKPTPPEEKPTPPEEKPQPPKEKPRPAEEKPKPAVEETAKPAAEKTEKPAVVPTAVPAGSDGPRGNVTLAYLGLAAASGAAAIGGVLYRRRHNL